MEEEEPDFELLENPARVLPAQVHCDFTKFAEKQKLPQHEQVWLDFVVRVNTA